MEINVTTDKTQNEISVGSTAFVVSAPKVEASITAENIDIKIASNITEAAVNVTNIEAAVQEAQVVATIIGIKGDAGVVAANLPITYNSGTQTVGFDFSAANTFTGQQIFNNSAPIIGSATASTIAAFDASKELQSLDTAAYPSLSELAYIKGVTSAIQTQLDSKQAAGSYVLQSTTVNGHALSSNVTVTKSDVGLGSIVNVDTTTTANITDSTNKRFVTDAQLVVIGNTSGTNTGDVTVTDSSEIDFTLTGQNITAVLKAASIDEAKLDTSVNASLTLANSSVQPARSISTTAPLAGGGDLSANRTLSITKATISTDGYLSSTDWNTFNSKGSGTVTSVSGTTNRITSTGGATPVIDISSSYAGQSSITTVGSVTSGTWNATTIAVAKGGTGGTNATDGLNNLLPAQSAATNGYYLQSQGNSASPPVWTSPLYAYGTQIDFGSTPVLQKEFTITNSLIGVGSSVTCFLAYTTPVGKSLDELEFAQLQLICGQVSYGQFKLLATSLNGPVIGKFRVILYITSPL